MSDDALLLRVQALEFDNARLKKLLERQGWTSGMRHQARNTLAMVLDVVRRSLDGLDGADDFAAHLLSRLDAVFRIQNVIANRLLDGVGLDTLVSDELLSHGVSEGEQVSVTGPNVLLRPAAAGSLALAIHELATNAIKFGALSMSTGGLAVSWTVVDAVGEAPTLALDWVESGVDDVPPQPPRRGFGLEVIEQALPYQIGGKGAVDFAPGGIRCTIRMPLTPMLGSLP